MLIRTCFIISSVSFLFTSCLAQEAGSQPIQERTFLTDNDLRFGAKEPLSAGIGAADFDADGDIDIAIINGRHWPRADILYLNSGTGALLEAVDLPGPRGTGYGACPGDLDADGDIDLVVARDRLPAALYINEGEAHFTFTRLGERRSSRDCALGDFNGDGIIDALFTARGGKSGVFFGPLTQVSSAVTVFNGNAVGAAVDDLNKDDLDDIVLTIRGGATLAVLLAQQDGGFADPILLGDQQTQSRAAAIADLDGDGAPEIIAAVLNGPNIIFSNASAKFSESTKLPGSDEISASVSVADFDHDGRLDLVFGNETINTVYMNRSTGFIRTEIGEDANDTYDVATPDLDGDGFADLVFANSDAPGRYYVNRPLAK